MCVRVLKERNEYICRSRQPHNYLLHITRAIEFEAHIHTHTHWQLDRASETSGKQHPSIQQNTRQQK